MPEAAQTISEVRARQLSTNSAIASHDTRWDLPLLPFEAVLHSTWRNFYTPDRRDVFAGFRSCAKNVTAPA